MPCVSVISRRIAAARAAAAPFDLVVLDDRMPGIDGYRGLEQAIAACAGRPVALMSGLAPPGVADKVLSAGAAGEIYMPLDLHRPSRAVEAAPSGLSRRALEVLAGLCAGHANEQIARKLNLREPTTKLHVKTICRKRDAKNRTQAAMTARERALC